MDENSGTAQQAPVYSILKGRKKLSIGLKKRTLHSQNMALKIK